MKKIAVIPARGGSKRIPRKNIKEFCGKPIIAYSIEAALQSGAFDMVMVSTDDEEIAGIARKYGAQVPFFRSEKTANDYANIPDVFMEVFEELEKRGEQYEVACCIFPTAPFISADRLKEGMDKLLASDADTLFPVVAFGYPPQRALVIENDRLVFKYPEYMDSRSQDLQRQYHDAAQFIMFRVDAFRKNKKFWIGNILPLEISEMEVQDIDTQTDWEIAEMKYRILKEKKGKQEQ